MARALRAFRDATGDEWDWSGGIILADAIDDLARFRAIAEGMAGVKEHHRKK